MKANVSEAQTGHCHWSWSSSQSIHSRAFLSCIDALPAVLELSLVKRGGRGYRCRDRTPIARQKRPEDLIQILAVSVEAVPEESLSDGPEFLERPARAPVVDDRSRFQSMNAGGFEEERQHELGAGHEQAGSPVPFAQDESPFSGGAVRRFASD